MLCPKSSKDGSARNAASLGRLDIVWRIGMGQYGKLQTAQLSRKVPPIEALEISVSSMPNIVKAEQPFIMKCQIRSNIPDKVRISVGSIRTKMGSVLMVGASEKFIGVIGAGQKVEVDLHFFPLYPGLHKISGLRLTDAISGTSKEIENLTFILVSS
jgi:hypothetical protein